MTVARIEKSMTANRKSNTKCRPRCQRKPGKKGHKSMRGVGEIWSEKKRAFNISLTEKVIVNYEKVGDFFGISRSEVIEKSGRGEINLLETLKLLNLVSEESQDSSSEGLVNTHNLKNVI